MQRLTPQSAAPPSTRSAISFCPERVKPPDRLEAAHMGMKISTIIRSNVAVSRAARPLTPPSAIETLKPYRCSQARMARQICGSSSTTKMRRITGSFAVPYAVPLSDMDRVTIFIAANQRAVLICDAIVAVCLPYTVYRPSRATWLFGQSIGWAIVRCCPTSHDTSDARPLSSCLPSVQRPIVCCKPCPRRSWRHSFRVSDSSNGARRRVTFRAMVARHEQALLAPAQQSAACNASHLVEARLARWLLRARSMRQRNVVDDTGIPGAADRRTTQRDFDRRSCASAGPELSVTAGVTSICKRGRPETDGLRVLRRRQGASSAAIERAALTISAASV